MQSVSKYRACLKNQKVVNPYLSDGQLMEKPGKQLWKSDICSKDTSR